MPNSRRERCRAAETLAESQDGVVSRAQLRGLGVDRFDVRTEVRARRWVKPGPGTVAIVTGEPTLRQRWWAAVLETGCPDAALDGITALRAAGLRGIESSTTVSCPHGTHPRRVAGVAVHVTRWRSPADHIRTGIPRVRPAAAAVHGGLWAESDRQAALVVVAAVQQRLTTPQRLAAELARIQRHPRRALLGQIIADVADGAHALGELDFARLCRQHRLPQPSRQAMRRSRHGHAYLDAYFDDFALVVEIDGAHHQLGLNPVDDALRQNELTIECDTVLRIPLLGLRLQPADFMAQVSRALVERGWSGD